MSEHCKHCGRDRWDHISVDDSDDLFCPVRFEPEPPRCHWCDGGVERTKRGDRRHRLPDRAVVCELDDRFLHANVLTRA